VSIDASNRRADLVLLGGHIETVDADRRRVEADGVAVHERPELEGWARRSASACGRTGWTHDDAESAADVRVWGAWASR
jgi:hypothetical protein